MQAAEADARPLYDKGMKLAEAGKTKEAVASLLEARAKLFNGPNAGFVHIDKGLSLQIAIGLAEQYEELEDEVRLKREIIMMDKGREWMSKEDEYKAFMYAAVNEVHRVWGIEHIKTGKRMKTKERDRLKRITRYMNIGGGDVLFNEGTEMRSDWDASASKAKRSYVTSTWRDFGSIDGVKSHRDVNPASRFQPGDLILVTNRTVSKVSGRKATFDFTANRMMPTSCKPTGELYVMTTSGRYVYKEKCSYKQIKGGHKLTVTMPKGLELKKGDVVTMYAKVKSTKGLNVTLETAAVVHSARKGKTQWLLGVKSGKPSFIEATGDFHATIVDDADAPPRVK